MVHEDDHAALMPYIEQSQADGIGPETVLADTNYNSGPNLVAAAAGYAYFGTWTSPGRVVKVALGAGTDPPTRVGAVTLNAGENLLNNAVIDAVADYAYFGTKTMPGRVVKVALGAGADPPGRRSIWAIRFSSGVAAAWSGRSMLRRSR